MSFSCRTLSSPYKKFREQDASQAYSGSEMVFEHIICEKIGYHVIVDTADCNPQNWDKNAEYTS
jgi:hypothetical protein